MGTLLMNLRRRGATLERCRRLKWLVTFLVAKYCLRTWMAAPMSGGAERPH